MNTTNIMKCFLVLLLLTIGIVIIWYTDLHKQDVPHAILHKYSLQKCLKKSGRFLSFPEYHECLYILAESRYCQDGLPVPKLVHYIFLGNRDFTFFYLLSILSSYRILKPGFIFVHTEKIPNGKWWDHLLELVPNLVIIKTTRVTRIFDKPVKVVQHQADIIRIQLLMEFGGIYMDTDELALKSFDPLRVYPITLGPCRPDALGVQVIIANKNSTFLKIWYWTYETFEDNSWAKNSQYMPYKLSRIIPELIHVERLFAFAGFFGNVQNFFRKLTDWSQRKMNTANIMRCFLVLLVLTVGIVIIWYADLHIKGMRYRVVHKYSLQECLKKNAKDRILSFPEYHECLYILAESRYCHDGLPVPKLVHYIFLGNTNFTFIYLLSLLSSYRILKPGFIFVHTNKIPNGKWWDHLLELVPNIVIIETTGATRIFDKPVRVVQHQADIMRIQLLMEFGGIYMDTDELALKSFDPLRVYPITLGPCRLDALGVQAIIASKNSTFLKIWYWTYKTFDDDNWAKNSQYMPYKLSRMIPELIHVENMFAFAGFSGNVQDIFSKVADWSRRYGIHLYIRLQKIKKSDPEHIKKLNSTYGQIARLIYYGKTEMIQ